MGLQTKLLIILMLAVQRIAFCSRSVGSFHCDIVAVRRLFLLWRIKLAFPGIDGPPPPQEDRYRRGSTRKMTYPPNDLFAGFGTNPPSSKAPNRLDFHRGFRFARRFARKGRKLRLVYAGWNDVKLVLLGTSPLAEADSGPFMTSSPDPLWGHLWRPAVTPGFAKPGELVKRGHLWL